MAASLTLYDNLLAPQAQAAVWAFISQPGWAHGGFSAEGPEADRYFYKHYAGFVRDGREELDAAAIEGQPPRARRSWRSCGAC